MNSNTKYIAIVRIDTGNLVYVEEYDLAEWMAARFLKPGTCYAKADTALQAISFARHEAAKFRRLRPMR